MAKLQWTPSYFTIFFINKSFFTLLPIQNCLQFDTITMILDKRVKPQGVSEEEHDFIIGTPMK